MESKPYSLQSPEAIARDYGGDKRKIASAVQNGLVDPTAALMAGMFIDRMRSAQSMEGAPTQTLAQQTFAPPAPPPMPGAGGLDAINPRPAPQLAAAINPQPPQAPPPGMAGGGLMMLNNPAFNEDSFAGGGVVAFADGGSSSSRRKRLMAIVSDPAASSEERMAARAELNKMEGKAEGAKPGKGLADALAYTYEGPRGSELAGQMMDAIPKGDPEVFRANMAGMGERIPSFEERTSPRKEPMVNFDKLPGYVQEKWVPSDEKGIPAPAWYGAGKRGNRGSFADLLGNDAVRQLRVLGLPIDYAAPDAKPDVNLVSPRTPDVRPPQFKVAEDERLKYSKGPYTLPNGQEGVGLEAIIPAQMSARASSGTQRGLPAAGSGRRSAASVSSKAPVQPDQTKDQLMAEYLKTVGAAPEMEAMSKEDIAARKNEDLWTTLAQIGFGTAAGSSQFALENIGKGAAGAMPGMRKALENRRGDEKEARRDRFQNELAKFGVKGDAYKSAVQQFEKMSDRKQQLKIQEMQDATQRRGQDINRDVGMAQVNRATGQERLVDMIVKGMPGGDTAQNRGKAAEYVVGKFGGEDRGAGIFDKAADNVQNRITDNISLGMKFRKLAREDEKNGTNLYETEYQRMVAAETQRLRSGALPGPMNSANAGSGGWKLLGAE